MMEHLVLATYPITNSCNISCPWCAAHLSSQPLFNTSHVLKALQRIPHPVHGVALTGGEPFASPRILDVKRELEENGYRVFAITNGTLHDKIWQFLTGNTLDVAMSVHNPSLFPSEVVEKKNALVTECRSLSIKMMAGLYSVDNYFDIRMAVESIIEHQDVFHTATISTVYRKDVPAMPMDELISKVLLHLPVRYEIMFKTPGKTIITFSGYTICLRRSPTLEEYDDTYNIPGCLFLAWDGEFYPVAHAQYFNEEVLA